MDLQSFHNLDPIPNNSDNTAHYTNDVVDMTSVLPTDIVFDDNIRPMFTVCHDP